MNEIRGFLCLQVDVTQSVAWEQGLCGLLTDEQKAVGSERETAFRNAITGYFNMRLLPGTNHAAATRLFADVNILLQE